MVIAYWTAGDLVVRNYATRTTIAAPPGALEILDYCNDWRTQEEIVARFDRFEPRSVRALVRGLAAHTMLQRSDRAEDRRERSMAGWGSWNPIAGVFHASTRDVPYEREPAAVERRLRRKAQTIPAPAPTKRYTRAPTVDLPAAALEGELSALLRQRRTWRDFSRAPIDVAQLATLAGLTWGVLRRDTIRGQGPVVFKTSPSAGARHPIEAYLLARRVRGVSTGLYHYDADAHRLAQLRRGATSSDVERMLGGQRWFRDAAAVFFMTAVFARAQWRYRSPRAYRTVLLDAGHLCQTFCLVATALNLAPFCTMALADTAIERALGLDGISESVIYAAGVGTRKPGAKSGAWPKDFWRVT